ncbi:MAG: hypothetical protein AMJ84_07050 [Acidithiobacillales bacterium SM23_46]|nr:MAG: hypothetical protein AMJ84_07050 [Acidithiobacillales bacterium SM23_46]
MTEACGGGTKRRELGDLGFATRQQLHFVDDDSNVLRARFQEHGTMPIARRARREVGAQAIGRPARAAHRAPRSHRALRRGVLA